MAPTHHSVFHRRHRRLVPYIIEVLVVVRFVFDFTITICIVDCPRFSDIRFLNTAANIIDCSSTRRAFAKALFFSVYVAGDLMVLH